MSVGWHPNEADCISLHHHTHTTGCSQLDFIPSSTNIAFVHGAVEKCKVLLKSFYKSDDIIYVDWIAKILVHRTKIDKAVYQTLLCMHKRLGTRLPVAIKLSKHLHAHASLRGIMLIPNGE